ncbi:MAG: hypothetical protein AAF497_13695 [Planctomycetota bacterium]
MGTNFGWRATNALNASPLNHIIAAEASADAASIADNSQGGTLPIQWIGATDKMKALTTA